MKTNSTLLKQIALYVAIVIPGFGICQFNPGLPANFGIDGDVLSGQSQNISGTTPQGSFDWFKAAGSDASVGYGLIDTTGASVYASQTAAGKNISFNQGMAYGVYTALNGYLLLDARYARDNFGLSTTPGLNDSTSFGAGAKNGANPTTWVTGPGSVPNKTDIIDSYVAMLRNGTIVNNTSPSHLILAMGVSTVGNTGDRYVDVELYKSPIAYNPAAGLFSNSGPAATGGHTAWTFNANGSVNTTGDLTVSFTYGTGGVSSINVYIWLSNSDYTNVSPTNFSFVSGGFNGSTYGYGQITPYWSAPFNAWGSVSSANTTATPWGTISKSAGTGTNNYSANYSSFDLGEVALDLTSLGIDPALLGNTAPCASPFTRVLFKSRSSASFTSALQDFSGPYTFLPVPSPSIAAPATLSCNVTSTTLSAAAPTVGAVYQWTTSNGSIVSSPNSTSITVNKAGKYYLSTAIYAGCPTAMDSITVGADNFKPKATASYSGVLINGNPLISVTLNGGDTTASKYSSAYGSYSGLAWNWSGPNGFSASAQNPVTNQAGNYTLIVTELSNGCKDTTVLALSSFNVLPVKYLSFDAVIVDNKSVKLGWVTGFTTPGGHFEVERSSDAKNFVTLGTVTQGSTTGANQTTYEYSDNSSALQNSPVFYYRLKLVDINGKATYSQILLVKFEGNNHVGMTVFPNPFVENVVMSFNTVVGGSAEVSIFNAGGQIVLSKQYNVTQGTNNLMVDGLSRLVPGQYIARLTLNGSVISNQSIIKH